MNEQQIDVLQEPREQVIDVNGEPSVLHGIDGVSPIANVVQTETGATITIIDRNGTTTANISNGQDGQDGRDGQDGVDGVSATIRIGTTTTGQAGTNASVQNVGTERDAILNFVIPRGEKGEAGTSAGGMYEIKITSIDIEAGEFSTDKTTQEIFEAYKTGMTPVLKWNRGTTTDEDSVFAQLYDVILEESTESYELNFVYQSDQSSNNDLSIDSHYFQICQYGNGGEATYYNAYWSEVFAKKIVQTISASSTHGQIPTAKCVYDQIGNVESVLATLNNGGGAQ